MTYINKIWIRNKVTPWQELDGKILVLTPQKNSVHELNETASFIWKEIDGKKNSDELIALLTEEFEVSPENAKNDFAEFVRTMQDEGLVVEY